MNPILARSNGPVWLPLAIFFGFIVVNLIAAILKRLLGPTQASDRLPTVDDTIADSDRFGPMAEPVLRPLSSAERHAKLEWQLRGVPIPGRTNRRGRSDPRPPPFIQEAPNPDSVELQPPPLAWAPLTEAPAALQEAHERLAYADAFTMAPLSPLAEAPAALKEADRQLTDADALTSRPHSDPPPTVRRKSLAAEMGHSLRDPATARGSIIAALILGRPKALE